MSRIFNDEQKWPMVPGQAGFNKYARQQLKKHKKNFVESCDDINKLQPWQMVVGLLTRPHTNIERLLVVQRTGLGKTRSMIEILNNRYDDTRPKIVIFPQLAVAVNFYEELMKFPNRYRDHVLRQKKNPTTREVMDILAMKGRMRRAGQLGELASPLRAMQYVVAGGTTTIPTSKHARSKNPVMNFGLGDNFTSVYDDKIVVCDEFHNLVRPAPEVKPYVKKLNRLAHAFVTARNCSLFGLTATPVETDVKAELQPLLDIIKGHANTNANNEGFLSVYNVIPSVMADVATDPTLSLSTVHEVTMQGNNLKKYNSKAKELLRKKNTKVSVAMAKLSPYCNASTTYRAMTRGDWMKRLLASPENEATKLAAVVDFIDTLPANEKTVMMMHRTSGLKAMEALLAHRYHLISHQHSCDDGDRCVTVLKEKDASSAKLIAKFNEDSNLRGEDVSLTLLDAKTFSEGVSQFAVRHSIIINVPQTYSTFKQIIGRSLRLCGHSKLPMAERNLTYHIFIAIHPQRAIDTSDVFFAELLGAAMAQERDNQRQLEDISIEGRELFTPRTVEDMIRDKRADDKPQPSQMVTTARTKTRQMGWIEWGKRQLAKLFG
jgi:superfamily II DNA or RNA helicase